jgi:tRNA A37 methylthiotransferase MiaB
MIYWFPGETINEYKESLKVLDVFDSTSFFCFSPKAWTIAANYDLLTDQELYKRTLLLFKISNTIKYSTYIHLSDSKYKKLIEKKYGTIWDLW